MLPIGSVIDGKYRILNKIGEGGMSTVYLAMNERANKPWAVKEVRREGVQDFEVVRHRLITETELLKKLNHPNLPSIVDVIEWDDLFLIVMDYIEGVTLDCVLKKYGAQDQEEVVEWAKQLCDVLCYLHSRQPAIIYRDLKPSNIMLRPDGSVVLIDFGIAREMKEGSSEDTVYLGTQGYAAPEQYGGCGQTDERTDIYCLGATLYHLFTGHNPGKPPYEMRPIRRWNPKLSSGLETIINKCTRKNPEERYQSCTELLYAFEHYRELEADFQKDQKNRWKIFAVIVFMTILCGGAAMGFRIAEQSVSSRAYAAYLREARALATTAPDESIEYYNWAVKVEPSRGEAYEELLNFFLWQRNDEAETELPAVCVFSVEEETEMRRILGSVSGGKSNEEHLKSNTNDYNKFAYNLGIAYFYSYQGNGNKAAAGKWLEIAAKASPGEGLNENNIKRAQNLYKIASYYDRLGIRNQAGAAAVSYLDYWIDLTGMLEKEMMNAEYSVSQLLIFKEFVSQIFSNAKEFGNAGVTRGQIEEQVKRVRQTLNQMVIDTEGANAEYEAELKLLICSSLELAEENLDAVFNKKNLDAGRGESNGADSGDNPPVS